MTGLRRRSLLGAALLAAPPLRAQDAPPREVAAELPAARLLGTGRLRFFALAIYDARLWVGDGFAPAQWWRSAFALELAYARALDGRRIAERSLDEMRRQAAIDDARAARWLAEMTRLFPDVRDGDRLSGVNRGDGAARFYLNGGARGELHDADFARLFFGIWLSPQTSEPRLREQLLGPLA